jgi:UDP-glucose 4-epimerase
MRTALITGIGGFIGSHLAAALAADGWAVIGIDNFRTGRTANLRDVRARIVVADVISGLARISGRPVDVIFHLAARVGPADVIAHGRDMLDEHHRHGIAVCKAAMAHRAKALVLASSSEVYGMRDAAGDVLCEDGPIILGPAELPRWAYAASKLNLEHIGLAYHRQFGVPTIVARLFNIVGPRQRPAFVLPAFADALFRGEPLTVHGDGSQARCFTHIDDAVTALIALTRAIAAIGRVVNVGAPGPLLTIAELAERVLAHGLDDYGIHGSIRHVPYDETGDLAWQSMRCRVPGVARLQALTGLTFRDRTADIIRDVCTDRWQEFARHKGAA